MTSWISDDSGGNAAALAGAGCFSGWGWPYRRAGGHADRDGTAEMTRHATWRPISTTI